MGAQQAGGQGEDWQGYSLLERNPVARVSTNAITQTPPVHGVIPEVVQTLEENKYPCIASILYARQTNQARKIRELSRVGGWLNAESMRVE